jgi:hypothetical protein
MPPDLRQFTLAVMATGVSYEAALSFTTICHCGPVPKTEFCRIQRELIPVVIEFARATAAASRDEIEEDSSLGIDDPWSDAKSAQKHIIGLIDSGTGKAVDFAIASRAIRFSKGNHTGHSDRMEV